MSIECKKIKDAWREEYQRKGIPSSFRSEATQAVIDFVAWLQERNFQGQVAADIGAGLGRNSFYLASQGFTVTALELLEENAEAINRQAAHDQLAVKAYPQDVAEQWPFETHSLDMIIDVFCYKHLLTKAYQKNYRQELYRTLKPKGFYLISLASEKDGFYGPLLRADSEKKQIVDPYSQLPSFLYSPEDLIKEFEEGFACVEIKQQHSISPMHGTCYSRSVIHSILTPV